MTFKWKKIELYWFYSKKQKCLDHEDKWKIIGSINKNKIKSDYDLIIAFTSSLEIFILNHCLHFFYTIDNIEFKL